MKLKFPNQSRSFDGARNRIRFWGYDSAIEISIFVEGDVLQKIAPGTTIDEAGYLAAFDSARDRIETVAREIYRRSAKGSYTCVLSAKDF